MSHTGSTNTTGGVNVNQGGAVIDVTGAVLDIVDLFKKKREGFDPLGVAKKTLINQQELAIVQARINASIAAGEPLALADREEQAALLIQKFRLQQKFAKQQEKKPKKFIKAGIKAGTTLLQLVELIKQMKQGQKILARFPSPQIPREDHPAFQTPTQGGQPVPFVVTPAASSTDSFGGFGDLITSVINAGATIGGALLAPKPAPVQQAGFGSLVPAGAGALGRALFPSLPAIGAGAVGGEIADSLQNFFSGGASTGSDVAAFTDPVPGSCRPKAHVKVNPCTGKGTWFTPRGTPLVFSGDMAACRRVDRVAKRLQKSMPTKRRSCAKR